MKNVTLHTPATLRPTGSDRAHDTSKHPLVAVWLKDENGHFYCQWVRDN